MKLFERYKYYNLFSSQLNENDFKKAFFEENEFFFKLPNLIEKIKEDINIVDFEKLLWYAHKINPAKIQISQNGKKINQQEIQNSDILRLSKKYLSENHSIVINFAEDFHPALATLTREFGEFFNGISYCSIFLNPPSLNCFGSHYDGIDVFALQIEGEKIWKVGKPVNPLPTKNQIYDIQDDKHEFAEYKLQQGDVLYVPRGFIHDVFSTEKHSLHISIGLSTNRKVDIYSELLKIIELENLELRRTAKGVLEKGYVYQKGEFVTSDFQEKLVDPYYIKRATTRINSKKYSQLNLLPNSYLQQVVQKKIIESSTEVIVSEGVIMEVNSLDTGKVVMTYPMSLKYSDQWISSSITLPLLSLSTLEYIRDSKTSFRVEDIPGLITVESKIILVKELLEIGVLKFA